MLFTDTESVSLKRFWRMLRMHSHLNGHTVFLTEIKTVIYVARKSFLRQIHLINCPSAAFSRWSMASSLLAHASCAFCVCVCDRGFKSNMAFPNSSVIPWWESQGISADVCLLVLLALENCGAVKNTSTAMLDKINIYLNMFQISILMDVLEFQVRYELCVEHH